MNGRKGEGRMRKGVVASDTPDPLSGPSLPYFFLRKWALGELLVSENTKVKVAQHLLSTL